MTKRALIYTRVSLDVSGKGESVARQEKACRALAEARGWEVVGVRSDNSVSAYGEKNRPAWNEVLRAVEAEEIDYVVAWAIDRMTRSMMGLEEFIVLAEKANVGVATVTGDIDLTTDVGRMVARILGAVARAEVERKAARQRLANESRALAGRPWTGGPRAFGYTSDGLEVVPEEAEAIRTGAALILAGGSLGEVARTWREAGFTSGRSHNQRGIWTTNGVKGVLTSPRTAGRASYRGQDVGAGTWEAILDADTHKALARRLGDPARRVGEVKKGATPTTLLTGIGECGECGGTITGAATRGRLTYKCRAGGCISVPRQDVDDWVGAYVVDLISSGGYLEALEPTGDDEVDEARTEAAEIRERLEGLAEAFAVGDVTRDQLTTASRTLRSRLEAAERLSVSRSAGDALEGLRGAPDVARAWVEAPLVQRRRVVDALLEKVALRSAGRSRKEPYSAVGRVVIRERS